MIHKAWCSIEEVPYHFSRSYIKFQGQTGCKIDDLDQIWARLLGRSQLSNPSDLPCFLKYLIPTSFISVIKQYALERKGAYIIETKAFLIICLVSLIEHLQINLSSLTFYIIHLKMWYISHKNRRCKVWYSLNETIIITSYPLKQMSKYCWNILRIN